MSESWWLCYYTLSGGSDSSLIAAGGRTRGTRSPTAAMSCSSIIRAASSLASGRIMCDTDHMCGSAAGRHTTKQQKDGYLNQALPHTRNSAAQAGDGCTSLVARSMRGFIGGGH